MTGRWLKLALGAVAAACGPLALAAWNDGFGRGGFATPVGGDRWFSTRPGFFETVGVGDPEMGPTGNVFNWTQDVATIRFPRLDRSKPAVVTMRIQGGGSGQRSSEVLFSVDGVLALRLPTPSVPKRVSLDLPRQSGRGAVITINVEGSDGVMLENVRLAALQGSLPVPREATAALSFSALVAYSVALMAGAPAGVALLLSVAVSTALGWLSVTGGAMLGRYSEHLAWIALVSLIASAAGQRLRDARWRRAFAAVVMVTSLKLAVLGHPQVIDADATFHAGNLRRVLSGDWFFTSATPPPAIAFPYPPGLSVAALPFSRLPQSDWVMLLRGIVAVAETMAALTFALAVAALSTEAVGAMTFVLIALSPEAVALLFVGNLSNLFSDALMIAGCACLIRRRQLAAFLLLLGGYLSHFGTLLIGAPLALALAFSSTERDEARPWRRVTPVLGAILASFLIYYRHFLDIVVTAWDRMTHLKGAAAAGPMTAPMTEKLTRIVGGEGWWLNALILAALLVGVVSWPRDRRTLTRVLVVWAVVILGFGLLGLVSPIQVRSALSARPVLATLAASGICTLWTRGRGGRILASAFVLLMALGCWIVAIGFFPIRPS